LHAPLLGSVWTVEAKSSRPINPSSLGGRPGLVVVVPRFKDREIELVIDELVEGVFESAGKNLLREGNRDELRLVVGVVLVSRHRFVSPRSYLCRYSTSILRIFLQLQRSA
jgi:hypothetical protein